MLDISQLPAVNAALNGVALTLIVLGWYRVRSGDTLLHRWLMIAAFVVSIMFLATYVTYRLHGAEKKFTGQGLLRYVYFFVLMTHVPLAAAVPFLAGRTLYLAARGRFEQHRSMARITLPIWVYVSVSGMLVYFLLFGLHNF